MESTWNHPAWGTFLYDGIAWTNTIEVVAFTRFSYDSEYGDTSRPASLYELSFEVDEEGDPPSREGVELAERLLANQGTLVETIAQALWNDFNGEGQDSGMWWRGAPDEVMEGLEDDFSLDGPGDIFSLLQVDSIVIYESVYDYEGPLAEIRFHAPFEEEHGVGVLTDGASIVGTGYAVSVTPFDE